MLGSLSRFWIVSLFFFFLINFGHSTNVLSCFSRVWLFAVLWTVAHQAPLSIGFSRQKYWSGLPCLPSGALTDPGIEPAPLMSPELAGGFLNTSPPGKPRKWQPPPVISLGEFHRQRSLAGYSPWGSQRVRHDWEICPCSLFLSLVAHSNV